MNHSPLVSVVIPVYNAQSTIVSTIKSVVNQTYKNIEIIVVNDGSKDNSCDIINDFIAKNKDFNIKLINKPNGGVSSARNAGIDMSTGQFIAFLDSDDRWVENKTEVQVNVFKENPHIDALGTNMNNEIFNKKFGIQFERLTRITPKMMLLKNFLCIQTVMVKKSVIDDVGYFFENQDNEDSNLIIRIGLKYNTYLLNESYVIYNDGTFKVKKDGVSSRLWEMEKGELENIRQLLALKAINPFEAFFYAVFSLTKFLVRVVKKTLS